MESPSWVKIVGSLMILFAGCGVTQDIKQINTKELAEFSNDLANEISRELGEESIGDGELDILIKVGGVDTVGVERDSLRSLNHVSDMVKSITEMSESAMHKLKVHGQLGLVLSFFYALAGLLLILTRKHVLKLVFAMLGISLLFAIYQVVDLKNEDMSKLMRIGINFNHYCGAFLDVVLLCVLAMVDKSYFTQDPSETDYYDNLDPNI